MEKDPLAKYLKSIRKADQLDMASRNRNRRLTSGDIKDINKGMTWEQFIEKQKKGKI